MKPPFEITPRMLNLTAAISTLAGRLEGAKFRIPLLDLRRQIDASSVHSSCVIEGNRLTLDQATDVINGKRVVGASQDILEVKNAFRLYESAARFDPVIEKDLLRAHGVLMQGLVAGAGKYRRTGVVVRSGDAVVHTAPSYQKVPELMAGLFEFIAGAGDLHPLISSSVFHYEFEFIHPFEDGNGRMGRFWQTLMLRSAQPSFSLLPIESAIKERQAEYYEAIAGSNRAGCSTLFIEFMLTVIMTAAQGLEKLASGKARPDDRVAFMLKHGPKQFTRRDYMQLVGDIAAHTASRDLRRAVESGLLSIEGDRARAVYRKTGGKK